MIEKKSKYLDIVEAARELFWKHGFRRVSVEEICRNANVSKMTFYKHFPNKTELAKNIFERVVTKAENQFREIMQGNDTPAEKINKVLLMKLEGTRDISTEFMQDFYIGAEPGLKKFVEEMTYKVWEGLKHDYVKAQQDGVFRSDFNVELLIKIQYKLVELIEDPTISSLYGSKQELIMEFARLLVYGIVPHE